MASRWLLCLACLTFPRLGKAGGLLALGISKRLMFVEQVDAAGHYQRVQIIHLQHCVIRPVRWLKTQRATWSFCKGESIEVWGFGEQNEQYLPLRFQIIFPINLSAFGGESGLWSFVQVLDCPRFSQSMGCMPCLDSDGLPP